MTFTKDCAKNILFKRSKEINENTLYLIPLTLHQFEKATQKMYYIKHLSAKKVVQILQN